MTDTNLYYTPPPDKCFRELKEQALALWSTMGDEPSYSQEKIGRIQDLDNIQDNFMYICAMFDIHNQTKLAATLSAQTRKEVRDRMVAGGNQELLIPF